MNTENIYIADLDKVGMQDLERVGGKNASLGEMLQHLSPLGIQIPNGFVITVAAYREFIRFNNLDDAIHNIINNIRSWSKLHGRVEQTEAMITRLCIYIVW